MAAFALSRRWRHHSCNAASHSGGCLNPASLPGALEPWASGRHSRRHECNDSWPDRLIGMGFIVHEVIVQEGVFAPIRWQCQLLLPVYPRTRGTGLAN